MLTEAQRNVFAVRCPFCDQWFDPRRASCEAACLLSDDCDFMCCPLCRAVVASSLWSNRTLPTMSKPTAGRSIPATSGVRGMTLMGVRRHLVKDWMTPDPIAIDPNTTLPEAARLMRECNIRRLPVVENGHLVGIITLGDVREASPSSATSLSIYELNYLISRLTVAQVMTRDPIVITPDISIEAAARMMLEHKIGCLPVTDGDKVVGIITESDIFRLLVNEGELRPTFA
jgi:acetoin utilization protein AcuB